MDAINLQGVWPNYPGSAVVIAPTNNGGRRAWDWVTYLRRLRQLEEEKREKRKKSKPIKVRRLHTMPVAVPFDLGEEIEDEAALAVALLEAEESF